MTSGFMQSQHIQGTGEVTTPTMSMADITNRSHHSFQFGRENPHDHVSGNHHQQIDFADDKNADFAFLSY